ncbi:MAG: hypothetical protein HYZ72_21405 [Deltaproteobacteria bacterium]|nr:hypothetical protein [Deltaproteobacteria bacterium]
MALFLSPLTAPRLSLIGATELAVKCEMEQQNVDLWLAKGGSAFSSVFP